MVEMRLAHPMIVRTMKLCLPLVLLLFCPADASPAAATVKVHKLAALGPWEIVEGDKPVLRYNYQMVHEPADVKPLVSAANRRYAVDRCDYIHPLYGHGGEVLTEDWPKEHPHHRGIYWAWPEVDWQGRRGDLHALQEVFARPTGKIRAVEGPGFAQIEAENNWCWKGETPIVREEITLRAWRETERGRRIDVQLCFTAIDAEVQVARRGRAHYGGLNLRFSPLAAQKIATLTDPPTAVPRMAWAQRSGLLPGGRPVAMTILQDPQSRLPGRLGTVSGDLLDPADVSRRGHALGDQEGPTAGTSISPLGARQTVRFRDPAQALE